MQSGDDESLDDVAAIAVRSVNVPLRRLHDEIHALLKAENSNLQYHGWPHVRFVTHVGMRLAARHGGDESIVGAACLVHDLNYVVAPRSAAEAGMPLAASMMQGCGFSGEQISKVQEVIQEADLRRRGTHLSIEASCLSDADSLFKALPTTPLLLARAYLMENRTSLQDLAEKIVAEQEPLVLNGNYFYFQEMRERYDRWAYENVAMWRRVLSSLELEEVELLYQSVMPDSDKES